MLTRIFVGLLLIPIVIAVLVTGGLSLRITLGLVSALALWEIQRAVFPEKTIINWLGYGFIAVYYTIGLSLYFVPLLFLWILLNLVFLVVDYKKFYYKDVFTNIMLPLYTGVSLSAAYLVWNYNPHMMWIIFLSAWGSDTSAYFSGKFFGKTKLCPNLSPSKTVAGAVGGVLGGTVITGIFAFVMQTNFNAYSINVPTFVIIAFIASISAELGDLAASAIKRQSGIKDFGNTIPGHGGFMDRFDSALFTAPVVYIAMVLMGGFV